MNAPFSVILFPAAIDYSHSLFRCNKKAPSRVCGRAPHLPKYSLPHYRLEFVPAHTTWSAPGRLRLLSNSLRYWRRGSVDSAWEQDAKRGARRKTAVPFVQCTLRSAHLFSFSGGPSKYEHRKKNRYVNENADCPLSIQILHSPIPEKNKHNERKCSRTDYHGSPPCLAREDSYPTHNETNCNQD